jgi:4'-phosphopantetheinyl transferase
MVHIFYTLNTERFSQVKWNRYLSEIPALFREKIIKLIRWEDRQNSLTGKLLLQYGLKTLYDPPQGIESLEISQFGKPFLSNQTQSLFFNISHSDCCSVCAFNSSEIGLDIERIKPIEFRDFFSVFTRREQEIITNSASPIASFYTIWTRKESVVKAQGSGLTNYLNEFCVSRSSSILNGTVWHNYPINISHDYISHIAVKERYPKISVQYIHFI